MITVVFALLSAALFGAGDFCGGAASRRAPVLSVLLVSLPAGIAILLPLAIGLGEPWTGPGLAWGATAGVAGGGGLLLFYGALARGPMSVVAPVSGLLAAAVPTVVGVARGERFTTAAVVGLLLCLVAIGFVSMERSAAAAGGGLLTSGPVLAAASGLSFGIFFVLLREGAGDDAAGTLWPLVAAKAAGLVIVAVIAAVRRGSLPSGRVTLGIAAGAGVLDTTGNALFLLAAQSGMLSVAGVLSSLYPASTVILARFVYGERLRPIQQFGMVVAVAGVVLVGAG